MCHFQIAPGLAVFSISEFKAVPRSRCNHLCDRRATISRQRSVTLYFFFLFSFLPSPFFSFSISAYVFASPSSFPISLSSRLFFLIGLLAIEICHLLNVSFLFFQNLVHRISFFLSSFSFPELGSIRTHCLGMYIFIYAIDRDPVSINR